MDNDALHDQNGLCRSGRSNQGKHPKHFICAFGINVIHEIIRERETKIARIGHDANVVSYELARVGRVKDKTKVWLGKLLARVGRVQGKTKVWLGSFPEEIAEVVTSD